MYPTATVLIRITIKFSLPHFLSTIKFQKEITPTVGQNFPYITEEVFSMMVSCLETHCDVNVIYRFSSSSSSTNAIFKFQKLVYKCIA